MKKTLLAAAVMAGFSLAYLPAHAHSTFDVRNPMLIESSVAVELGTEKRALTAADDVMVTISFRNDSAEPMALLKWYTPVDGIEDAIFSITRDGKKVDYTGPHYKRPAPRAEDYVLLQPGESFTRTYDLSQYYDFSVTGNYEIRYAVSSSHLIATKNSQPVLRALVSPSMNLFVVGRAMATPAQPDPDSIEKVTSSVSFTGNCSNTRKTAVLNALNSASTYANTAYSYLSGTPGAKTRYTTWFGSYSLTRWNTAKSHFQAIKGAIDSKPLVFDCSCTQGYYAYVYPTQPYKIYLCNAFWSAPQTGTDSKAGTIIHELSHFNVVAATDDHAYGQSAAKSLAASSPTKALDNADNHEYFAENTPYLP